MSRPAPHPKLAIPSEVEFFSVDISATSDFFASAFGWKTTKMLEHKMSTANWGMKMTGMVRNDEAFPKDSQQKATLYMTVKDIDVEVARLTKLGASVFKAPTHIPGMGAWGYMKAGDVIFGLWANAPEYNPPERVVTKKAGDDGTLTFFEILSSQAEDVADFFNKAYFWGFDKSDFHGESYWYSSGDQKTFSVGLRGLRKGEKGANVLAFVNISTIAEALATAKKAGAKAVGKQQDYAPHGTAQLIQVPGDLSIGLWESPADKKAAGTEDEKKKVKAAKPAAKASANRGMKRTAGDRIQPKRAAKKAKKE